MADLRIEFIGIHDLILVFYYPTKYKLNSYIFDILIAPWRHKLALNSAMIASIPVEANLCIPYTF